MAEDDLRYPEEMVAGKHWERKISTLKEGVGSMPGKPLQKIDKDVLQSGRGLIP